MGRSMATWVGSARGDADAAVAGLRLQPGAEVVVGTEALEDAAEEVEVHPAHELALLRGQAVERAVRQRQVACRVDLRLVAVVAEHRGDGLARMGGLGC